ncbi:hypothetical protein CONPUDRAFT_126411 [Coniophora puteana RWD-64-598 SS2]|uniref:P-loop containing nucleoside triphosphate hydrolase protein n=1 Tax=Coniophora puteana (strain RWD-64-598) TaxID=741705 RepID=A0A5M3MLQ4_CONPW|nr:uncharacterized protein CONPUDRAFT_126411 [Coniophora puteana RWD-64-598 SS2]EIW79967.1 hypothetical protein CONPUDRAFT_126411 [Coniophora puteana RWD-64-598 SS2]
MSSYERHSIASTSRSTSSDTSSRRRRDTSSDSSSIDLKATPSSSTPAILPQPTIHSHSPTPSFGLLFSFLTPRRKLTLLAPAIASSVVSGGIAPFMTYVVGQSFNAFAAYPLTANPPQAAKDALLHGVGLAAIELVALGVGALLMSSITSSLWIWTGEHNVVELRRRVYESVTRKDITWFDLRMGSEGDVQDTTAKDAPIGAGGLMAKFARETDDVRTASSLASGQLLQYLTTTITCLILAFTRSPLLTLVILSAVPSLIIIQALSQGFAAPRLARERSLSAAAASLISRSLGAIATVKAFNAAPAEHASLARVFASIADASQGLARLWGGTAALSQFVSMAMFVQGFWFGAHLVRDGRNSAGDVMAVFWACLIATSNLQMAVPLLVTVGRGKASAAALAAVVADEVVLPPPQNDQFLPSSPCSELSFTAIPAKKGRPQQQQHRRRRTQALRKILPRQFVGELALTSVSFAYPARPDVPVLRDVSLFLPARETTFVVGASGSGKSTLGALLRGEYAPCAGSVLLDEQDMRFLDNAWVRTRVGGVCQGSGVVFGGKSVFENVAVGAVGRGGRAEDVEVKQVVEACRMAMLESWVGGLEEGYETVVSGGSGGGEGVQLSGGQRQRVMLARARIRDPDVLILDEPTSALDPPTRALIMAAIRRWRQHKTTVVITHDLASIEDADFVYVMKAGQVVEQGFRADLVVAPDGEFVRMLGSGGVQDADQDGLPGYDDVLAEDAHGETSADGLSVREGHLSIGAMSVLRPVTQSLGNWMFDVVSDLTRPAPAGAVRLPPDEEEISPLDKRDFRSQFVPAEAFPSREQNPFEKAETQAWNGTTVQRVRRPSSMSILPSPTSPKASRASRFELPELSMPPRAYDGRRMSLQWTPTSPTFSATPTVVATSPTFSSPRVAFRNPFEDAPVPPQDEGVYVIEEDDAFEMEKAAMDRSGALAATRRSTRASSHRPRRSTVTHDRAPLIKVDVPPVPASGASTKSPAPGTPGLIATIRMVYPSIPNKPLLALGLLACLASGSMTPVFSFLLSKLMFEVSAGASDASLINAYGALVLGIAALDGLLLGTKYGVMESLSMRWAARVRGVAFARVVRQDKAWFDRDENGVARVTQGIVKDADDARVVISVVMGQCVVVCAMLGLGLVWAMAWGWQLTLVGLAVAPVFVGVMGAQSGLVAKCEVRNKRAREEVGRVYYESILNIRAIRGLALEPVLAQQFETAAAQCLSTGRRGAFVEGCTYGVASALIYLAEALLFYVGAVLMSKGTYTYLQMVQTLNLVVFTVTIGSQLMAFTQRIAKCVRAANDLHALVRLEDGEGERQGMLREKIKGDLVFDAVEFSYPTNPTETVLRSLSMRIRDGECVALVGGSGCGKSTVAALLQRLYEPTGGAITVGGANLSFMDVKHLRDHVAVVSQNPNLFDASVRDNIAYGHADRLTQADVERAARAAHVHDFVMSLPQGYGTLVGENAALISGGQAQRLQLARALARPSKILILDECTSALDAQNQAAVLETVREAKVGRTTLVVTHKVPVMRMCDRIVVLEGGRVVEEGTFESLVERRGSFAKLASGGEWVGE